MMTAKFLSSDDSSWWQNLLLISLPGVEFVLLFIILLSGLNKVDAYHMLYLFMFVGYLVFPKKKSGITNFCIVYSFIFIIIKQMYTMIQSDWIDNNEDFLDAMGFATLWTKPPSWQLFEYGFKFQQWAVLAAAYMHVFLLQFLKEEKLIEAC